MKIHTATCFNMYTDWKGGGLGDIAHVRLEGMTLVDNEDLARLRQIAASTEAEPIPAHIVEVLGLCLKALSGPRGAKPKTRKGLDAWNAVRDLLAAALAVREEA
jgi:hypothetical protein